jgi:hypothetical protein
MKAGSREEIEKQFPNSSMQSKFHEKVRAVGGRQRSPWRGKKRKKVSAYNSILYRHIGSWNSSFPFDHMPSKYSIRYKVSLPANPSFNLLNCLLSCLSFFRCSGLFSMIEIENESYWVYAIKPFFFNLIFLYSLIVLHIDIKNKKNLF